MLIFMVLYFNDSLFSYNPATFYAKKCGRRIKVTQKHCLKNFPKAQFLTRIASISESLLFKVLHLAAPFSLHSKIVWEVTDLLSVPVNQDLISTHNSIPM